MMTVATLIREKTPMDALNLALPGLVSDNIHVPAVEYGEALDTPSLRETADFSTAPVLVRLPIMEHLYEEELHRSFEQAINGRLIALNLRLSHISGPLIPRHSFTPVMRRILRQWRRWRSNIIQGCASAILVLAGFDLAILLLLGAR